MHKVIVMSGIFLCSCGDSLGLAVEEKSNGNLQMEVPFSETIELDNVLIKGYGESNPSTFQSEPQKFEVGRVYELTFQYYGNDEAKDRLLYVDLFPDTLPETTFVVNSTPQEAAWEFSSEQVEINSATVRFFGFYSTDAEVHVKNIRIQTQK